MADSPTQRERGGEIDWRAIEASPEFQELVRRKRSFVLPGTLFFLAWYMAFILLTAYAEDFMARRVYEGLTVGYCLALTQFLMVLVLGILYLRKSANVFDPLAARAIERHESGTGRFARGRAEAGVGDDTAVGSRRATGGQERAR
jgi:uncharacterized membrane protein (DUF485 family)